MDKYIKELISEKDTVIIPKFGALLVTVSGKGIIMFNEHLKFNDGLLVGYVADKEGIDKDAALQKIEAYAFKIMGDLDTGEPYSIEGLGAFYKDASGSILFNQYKNENSSAQPVEPILEKKPTKKEEKTVKEENVKDKVKPEQAKAKVEKKAQKEIDKKAKENDKKETEADKETSKKEDKKTKTKSIKEEETPKKDKQTVKPVKSNETEEVKTEAKKEDNKSQKEAKVEAASAVLSALSEESETEAEVQPSKDVKKEAESSARTEHVQSQKEKPKTETDEKAEEPKETVKEIVIEETVIKASQPMDHVSPTNEKVELPPVHVKDKKPRKKKRLGVLILILVLIGLGTFVGLKFDKVKSWFATEEVVDHSKKPEDKSDKTSNQEESTLDEKESEVASSETDEVKDTTVVGEMALDTEQETDVDPEPEPEPKPEVEPEPDLVVETTPEPAVSSGSSGQFHIIASAFRSESNADNYVSSLKSMGFGSASKLGKINGLYTVSAGSYNSNSDAKSALSEVREKTGKAAWVLKY